MMEKLVYFFEKRRKEHLIKKIKDPCFFMKIMGFEVNEQQKVLLKRYTYIKENK